jgi:nitrate reductase delta subunit
MSDYYTALKAWQAGRNDPGATGTMPEGFRIRPALKRSPEHVAALEQVRQWTRSRFKLSEEAAVMAAEVACRLPGCPPLETVVAFWADNDQRHQFKVFKRVEEVVEDDIPPAWLKGALVVDEDADFDCC